MNAPHGHIALLISLAGAGAAASAQAMPHPPSTVDADGLAELEWQGPLEVCGQALPVQPRVPLPLSVALRAAEGSAVRPPTAATVGSREAAVRRPARVARGSPLVLAALPRVSVGKIDAASFERTAPVMLAVEPPAAAPQASLFESPATSSHVDRVLEALQAVLHPDAAGARALPPSGAAHGAESPSDRVLRTLEATLSNARDEVGAPLLESPPSAAAPLVEDGPARHLRKLAARAAKTAAEPPAVVAPAESAGSGAPVDTGAANPFGERSVAVADMALDQVRGGFVGNGLNISFGIERAVYINGALVATTTLNVSELGKLTAGRGSVAIDAGTIAAIQNGMGNSVSASALTSTSAGTIVQNTLDGQKIQNITVINATANSLGVLRGLNFQSSLRGAVVDSLRR
jgi:hypothetical protein